MDLPTRRSIRMPGFDYSSPGAYFITTCSANRRHLFGSVSGNDVLLNSWGQTIEESWRELPDFHSGVVLDEMIVMPNHFHGILTIVGGSQYLRPTLSRVIRTFKSRSARRINREREAVGVAVWQRGFYERVIRDELALTRIREYIRTNPLRWSLQAGRGPAPAG
jgi:putative transposase